jgi:hypothetical protein
VPVPQQDQGLRMDAEVQQHMDREDFLVVSGEDSQGCHVCCLDVLRQNWPVLRLKDL